jgi:hypothetical protein
MDNGGMQPARIHSPNALPLGPAEAVSAPDLGGARGTFDALVATGMAPDEALGLVTGIAPERVLAGHPPLTWPVAALDAIAAVDPEGANACLQVWLSDPRTRLHDLDLAGRDWVRCLPEGLTLKGALTLDGCDNLTALPEGMQIRLQVFADRCTSLASLPASLEATWVGLAHCPNLRKLPERFRVKGGDLHLEACPALEALPDGLRVDGDLRVIACGIRTLGAKIQIKGHVELTRCLDWDGRVPADMVAKKTFRTDLLLTEEGKAGTIEDHRRGMADATRIAQAEAAHAWAVAVLRSAPGR